MNKHLHRIVFNKARGVLMAVSEIARSHCSAASGDSSNASLASAPEYSAAMRPTTFALWATWGLLALVLPINATAQIVADPNAPANQRPTIIGAGNGVPVVNIQTPSAAGVSRNTYKQFDVQQQGAILNNARSNAQTQLGGWVQGNPWLAGGTARVILNEVNSNNPSLLRGYVEVAGDRAQVVIANPAGVTCDGCGFINANRATLTTGTPILNGGNLEGYRVQRGTVSITGAGLDSSRTDYTDVIARAVEVNAGIWAQRLNVVAGANNVSVDASQAHRISGSGAAPIFGIDVSQLGGMYAGKITLIGTEAGVGVRNAGSVGATAGALVVTADGRLENSGTLYAQGALQVAAHGDITNIGTVASQNTAALTATSGNVTNADGLIASNGGLSLTADGLDNQNGQIQALGNMSIQLGTGTLENTASQILAGGELNVIAGVVENSSTQSAGLGIEGKSATFVVDALNNRDGSIRTDESLSIVSHGLVDNTRGNLASAGTLAMQDSDLSAKVLEVTNTDGTIYAGQSLVLDSKGLSGDGALKTPGNLTVKLDQDFSHSGQIIAGGNASVETTGVLTNAATLQAGDELKLQAATIDNQSTGEITGTKVSLVATSPHTLTNRGLIDGQDTILESATVNNLGTGRIYGDHVAIGADTLTNAIENGDAPVIAARSRLDIGAQHIVNSEHALIFSAGDMAIGGALDASKRAVGQAAILNNMSATIESLGNLDIAVTALNNTNEHFTTTVVNLGSQHLVEYQGSGAGVRYAAGTPGVYVYNDESDHLHTPQGNYEQWLSYNYYRNTTESRVLSSDPGQILSGGAMNLSADTVLNDKSQIIAGGDITGSIGTLSNTEVSGQRVITDSGTVTSYWRDHQKGRDSTGSSASGYHPAARIESITLTPTVYRQNDAPTGTGTQLGNRTAITQVTPPSGTGTIMSGGVNLGIPNNSLFSIAPSANYLVETDPKFANYRTWLSSDYLLTSLSLDPVATQKRLGDGFYEQKLIREQIAQLTGRRFLDGYSSDEAQYMALMNNVSAFAQAHQLVPGVALTAAQMAALTTDIVWLVEKQVTLPNGQIATALVPQVYVRVQDGDLKASGALIAADSLNLNISGDLKNSGSIAGRNVLALTAENINNLGGRISAKAVDLVAQQNLNNIGGTITAETSLRAIADNELNVVSTTSTQTSAQGSRTNVDRVAGLYVTGNNGTLVAAAGNDLNLMAAAITNAAANDGSGGATVLVAGNNLNLGTVTESSSNHIVWDDKNQRKDSSQVEIGTTIQTQGNIALQAGNDLVARAASVSTSDGALTATAGRDILLTAGKNQITVDETHQHKSKGLFSSKTITTRDTLDQTVSQGTLLSGNTVAIGADRDITVSGSQVVSTDGTMLIAQRNLSIEATTDTTNETHLRDEKKSGLMSSGGFGITLGSRQLTTDTDNARTTAAASTVGSIAGNVQLLAGENYRQVGSDVIAPQGDIDIAAQKVDIVEARETSRTVQETKFKQSGLTLAITSPVISAIQTAQQMSQAAKDTKDDRMALLAAANTGFAAKNAYDAIKAGQGTTIDGKANQIPVTNDKGDVVGSRDATAAEQAGGINISLSIGSSQSSSKTTQTSDSAAGSTVAAGRNVTITANGAGQDSDITVQGSNIKAGNNATLIAEDELKLLAARNSAEQHSTNKNSSASLGISFGTNGLMFNAGVSGGKGKADGSDVAWTNTHVDAGNTLTLQSGGDTSLKGAVATGKQVIADVGGNLTIESLQDTSKYDSKQKSFGVSVSVGMGAMSGSLSASKSSINSDYASVIEQSGIKAGDGGFQVNVHGHTDLKGAVIASTEQAILDNKNSFQTASLSMSDIQNSAHYDAKSVGVNIGSGVSFDGSLKPSGTGAGFGKDSDNASSTTQSGVSGIAGNKEVRTGDAESGIQRIFDADRVEKEIAAQQQITQKFNELAPKAAASHAVSQIADLRRRAEIEADPERKAALLAEAAKWAPNGSYTIAMNLIIGAAGGNLESSVTKETLSWAANEMRQAVIADSKRFPGVCDTQGNCISNQSGSSVGVNGDNFKAAGGRIVLVDWCAEGRCEQDPTTESGYKQNPDGTVIFKPTDKQGNPTTLAQFVAQNESWRSPLGGHQGGEGQIELFGIKFNYEKGSFWDKLAEAYAGTHDTFNSGIWYDSLGNGKNLDGTAMEKVGKAANNINVLLATPFAASTLLPPEVWSAIFLFGKK
jgi:filamentous hemagglutinin